jgi:hypothetical protein
MARDCGGWTRTGCEDFKPKDKFGREGPRRKELPGGTDGAVFRKRKREFDAPKLREIAKNQCGRKERLKSRRRRLEKRRNNLMQTSLVGLKESKCIRRDSSKSRRRR